MLRRNFWLAAAAVALLSGFIIAIAFIARRSPNRIHAVASDVTQSRVADDDEQARPQSKKSGETADPRSPGKPTPEWMLNMHLKRDELREQRRREITRRATSFDEMRDPIQELLERDAPLYEGYTDYVKSWGSPLPNLMRSGDSTGVLRELLKRLESNDPGPDPAVEQTDYRVSILYLMDQWIGKVSSQERLETVQYLEHVGSQQRGVVSAYAMAVLARKTPGEFEERGIGDWARTETDPVIKLALLSLVEHVKDPDDIVLLGTMGMQSSEPRLRVEVLQRIMERTSQYRNPEPDPARVALASVALQGSDDPHDLVQFSSHQALSHLVQEPGVTDYLVDLLSKPGTTRKWNIASALASTAHEPKVAAALMALAKDGGADEKERAAAVKALARAKAPEVRRLLEDLAQNGSTDKIRAAARKSLQSLDK